MLSVLVADKATALRNMTQVTHAGVVHHRLGDMTSLGFCPVQGGNVIRMRATVLGISSRTCKSHQEKCIKAKAHVGRTLDVSISKDETKGSGMVFIGNLKAAE